MRFPDAESLLTEATRQKGSHKNFVHLKPALVKLVQLIEHKRVSKRRLKKLAYPLVVSECTFTRGTLKDLENELVTDALTTLVRVAGRKCFV